MATRKEFLIKSSLAVGAGVLGIPSFLKGAENESTSSSEVGRFRLVIATWPNLEGTAAAWQKMQAGGSALDGVEEGVRVPEADPKNNSVSYGGLPDRDGKLTLDACIMDKVEMPAR